MARSLQFIWHFLAITQLSVTNSQPNILYIVVDDLRPELPMYGQTQIHAPNLEKLGARSLIFDRAYCNQPVCSPSRNSFMSGRRPDHTKIWNFISDFRQVGPHWTTLPSHFKANGYLTLGTGKLYHEGHPVNGDGVQSWSPLAQQFSCNNSGGGGGGTYCDPKMLKCDVSGSANAPHPRWCAVDVPMNTTEAGSFADVDTLNDYRMKLEFAVANKNKTRQPFFLGVGLRKPHLDWRIPEGFLKLYQDDIPLATHQVAQADRPPISIHGPWRSSDEKQLWNGWGYTTPYTPINPLTAKEMRRYYYAATSFMDSMVGRILDLLEQHGQTQNTIVAFHSDHGWSLGENGDWRKFTLTELGTRVPMMISVPWLPHTFGKHTQSLVELVDVMPTLSNLSGLGNPIVHQGEAPFDGISLAPLFSETPPLSLKTQVLSQYPRCPQNLSEPMLWEDNWCIQIADSKFGWMGYSLRTDDYRYTAWFRWDGDTLSPTIPSQPVNGTDGFYNELFSYINSSSLQDFDQLDTREVARENPTVVAQLHAALLQMITSE